VLPLLPLSVPDGIAGADLADLVGFLRGLVTAAIVQHRRDVFGPGVVENLLARDRGMAVLFASAAEAAVVRRSIRTVVARRAIEGRRDAATESPRFVSPPSSISSAATRSMALF
jgi:hypothetical protein